jgi:hypothetical protein
MITFVVVVLCGVLTPLFCVEEHIPTPQLPVWACDELAPSIARGVVFDIDPKGLLDIAPKQITIKQAYCHTEKSMLMYWRNLPASG